MTKSTSKWPDLAKRLTNKDVVHLSRKAKDAVGGLYGLTRRRSKSAARELHSVVELSTQLLTALCWDEPELFVSLAEIRVEWPVLYHLHRDGRQRRIEFCNQLKLGSRVPINLARSGKTFSFKTPAAAVAVQLFNVTQVARTPVRQWGREAWNILGDACRGQPSDVLKKISTWGRRGAGKQLPALSKNSATEWAKRTADLMRIVYGQQFECNEVLRPLRSSVLLHAKDNEQRPSGDGVVRRAMINAVKQAWHSVAAEA